MFKSLLKKFVKKITKPARQALDRLDSWVEEEPKVKVKMPKMPKTVQSKEEAPKVVQDVATLKKMRAQEEIKDLATHISSAVMGEVADEPLEAIENFLEELDENGQLQMFADENEGLINGWYHGSGYEDITLKDVLNWRA